MPNAPYRRHLPHFDAVGRAVFVTWNLKGALPAAALRRIREERKTIARLLDPPSSRSASTPNESPNVGRLCKPTLPSPNKDSLLLDHARKIFRISEDFLDRAEPGPRFLLDPNLAAAARDAILEGANKWYLLFAFVVMPNHVHLLIRPTVPLDRITMAIKRRAAKEINLRRNTPGQTVWQDESFDHFPRDAAALSRIIAYIERNPVAAGLSPRETDWPFSSAPMRASWPPGAPWNPAP